MRPGWRWAALLALAAACTGCSREARSARFLREGIARLSANDVPAALEDLQRAVELSPLNAEARYRLAIANLAIGNGRVAAEELEKAIQANPRHWQAHIKLAEMMATSWDPSVLVEAQQRLTHALAQGPGEAGAITALGIVEWKLGNQEQAQRRLEQAVLAHPAGPELVVALAKMKSAAGNAAGAEALLRKAVAEGSVPAMVALAGFYAAAGRNRDAETELLRALSHDTQHGAALMSLAVLQAGQNRIAEAADSYRKLSYLPDARYRPLYGLFLIRTGKADLAVAEFERLWKQEPSNRTLRTGLITAYLAAGRNADAARVLRGAVNVEYPDFDAQFQKAVLDLAANRVADAQTSIVGALRLRPESAEAHYVMAAAYLRRAQVMSSIDELDQTLRRDPHFLPARIELARYRVAANAPEVALELLANTPEGGDLPALAVERGWALLQWGDRDRLRTHFEVRRNNRGNAQQIAYALWLLETGNPAAASRIAEELLRSNPSDMRGLLVLARCRLVTAGPDAALETIRSYAARERTPAVLHFWGELLSIAHRPPEAVEALRAATASGSVTPVLAVSVARAELRAGQVASAEGRLKGLAAADPLDYQARFLLGVAQQMRGEYAAAAESYGKVLDSIPSHVPSLYNLAYLLAEHLGKPEQALHIAEKARELAPESPAVDDVFGWVLYRRGLKPLAAIHLSAAAAAGSVRARYHLAMVRLESGDAPGARQALAEALKRDPDLPEAAAVQRALNPPGGAASAAPAMPDALAIGWEDLGESNNVAARIEAYQRTRGCEPGPATLSALWNERNPRRFTMAVVLPLTLCEPRPTLTPTPLAANIPEDPSSNWANPDLMLQTLFDLSGVNAANAAGWDNTFVSWDTDRKGIPAKVKPSLYQTRDGTLRPPLHPDEAGWNVYDSIWPRTFR